MQKTITVLSPGLLFGIVASLLLHGSLLGVKAIQHPAEAQFDRGVVSVELTLIPSIASVAATKPVPAESATPVEPAIEPPPPVLTAIEPEIVQQTAPPEGTPPEPVQEIPEPSMQESVNAIDQDGSLEEDKGSFSPAQTQSQYSPIYPRMSRQRGEEGVVILTVEVSSTGQGSNVKIVQSSGHTRLDKAAIKALSNAQFAPAIRFGQPHTSTLTQTFNFKLTNDY
ncbi:MAG: TonB family protein [Pontiella sp.]